MCQSATNELSIMLSLINKRFNSVKELCFVKFIIWKWSNFVALPKSDLDVQKTSLWGSFHKTSTDNLVSILKWGVPRLFKITFKRPLHLINNTPYANINVKKLVRSLVNEYHRYLKNIDCLSFNMCLLLTPHPPWHFFVFLQWPIKVLIRHTRQAVQGLNQSIFP